MFELTDNTGAQASAESLTPHAPRMQAIAARRAEQLTSLRVFTRSGRVASADNRWADMLSRGRSDAVVAEAAALGLSSRRVHVPDDVRDLASLLA